MLVYSQSGSNQRLGQILGKIDFKGVEEDPESRMLYELSRLVDPATGKLPPDYRSSELEYFENHLKVDFSASRSENFVAWENRGPFNVGGRTRALALDIANEDIILAGGVSGGMWRSTDAGQTWTKATETNSLQSVTTLVQDIREGQTNTWYYGTGEFRGNSATGVGAPYRGDGIFKSTDNGASWTQLASTVSNTPQVFDCFDYVHELALNPTNGALFAATYCAIYRSTDGGESFEVVYDLPGDGGWSDVVITSDGIIYAFAGTDAVIASSDNGDNWANISDSAFPVFAQNERGELAIAPSNENILYMLAEANSISGGYAFWKYDASTDVWVNRTSGVPSFGGQTGDFESQGSYNLLVKVKPDDENFVILGGRNLWRSTNGFSNGSTTDWIGGYTPANNSFALYTDHHPDQHSFVFYYSDANKAISGNDGGLQYAPDIRVTDNNVEPITWQPLNNGYLTTQTYAISIGPGDQILAGFQDNGTYYTGTVDGEVDWSSPFGGDGAYSAFNSDGTERFLSSQNANIFRASYANADATSASEFTSFTPNEYSANVFITPFYLDTKNDNLFYLAGDSRLWINTEAMTGSASVGWNSVNLPNINGVATEIGVFGNGVLYVGTSGGQVYKVTGAETQTPTVTNVSSNLFSNGYVSGIDVNEFNEDQLVAVVSNYNIPSVFYSNDGGQTWTNISGNLEESPDGTGAGPSVRSARILGDLESIIVGTSVGAYSTSELSGQNTIWTQENIAGVGAVVVEHIVRRNEDGLVVAATHGNGIYSANLAVSVPDNDLSLKSILEPNSGILGTEQILISLQNRGVLEVNNFSLSYSVDDVVQETISLDTLVVPQARYEHTFNIPFDFSVAGDYNLTVSVDFPADENLVNNEVSKIITSLPTVDQLPFNADFEDGVGQWQLEGEWEVGIAITDSIGASANSSNVLYTDLDDNYDNSGFYFAETPIFNFEQVEFPAISFDIFYKSEEIFDGLVLAYRTGADAGYFHLPDTFGVANWYVSPVAAIGELDGWHGFSGEYLNAQADLSFLASESYVQLAFVFASDNSVVEEGVAIDNVSVYDATVDLQGNLDLTSRTIEENQPAGADIGALTVSSATNPIYSLVPGPGGVANSLVTIDGDRLLSAETYNFEEFSNFSVRVRVETDNLPTFEQILRLEVRDVNDAPDSIWLSNSDVLENSQPGTFVGRLIASDEDDDSGFVFSLGSNDESEGQSFEIQQDSLFTIAPFDFEEERTASVSISVSDSESATFEGELTLNILNRNDPPTRIYLSDTVIKSNIKNDEIIGQFTADDQDDFISDFDLVAEEFDNAQFTIMGTNLRTNGLMLDDLSKTFVITVRASDNEGSFLIQPFELSVEEVLGLANLAAHGVSIYPNPVRDRMYLKVNNRKTGEYSFSIVDMQGRVVKRQNLAKKDPMLKVTMDVSTLSPGSYILQINNGESKLSGKIVIR